MGYDLTISDDFFEYFSATRYLLDAGVARTAYDGIVSCFVEGIRIFLIPNKEIWTGYNVAWS
ncbi:unnamed protein product [Caenorhabditis auriculariae]|uniref:Alpha-1,3-mannosyl-glycoprotein 2-beta-N-acetylglucosaminyltransferase n=1 Tax=Caenorhabditis auriculariae TaxID=2777116 RepID=A0A8S1HZI1_9PELO|nr:unnamed protein product [Caenorhabditis auriculariae]